MSAVYLQHRYGPHNIAALRADIRDAKRAWAREAVDPYYPKNDPRGVDALIARLHELRGVFPAGAWRRNAVLWRVNNRRFMSSEGMTARANYYRQRTIELMRSGNINQMYLEN